MAVRRMTANTVSALKSWPNSNSLDFAATIDPAVIAAAPGNNLPRGTIVHVGSNYQLTTGVGDKFVMPMITFYDSDNTTNDGGNPATTYGAWRAASPQGLMTCIVAKDNVELVVTHFNKTGVYAPNTPLTAPLAAGGGVEAGQLTPGTLGTHTICGLTSRGVVNNGYGHNALAFWPTLYPVYPA